MPVDYIHSEPGTETESVSGHYVVQEERRLDYGGRELLVVFGYAVVDKSCCGGGAGCRFANVPGYVLKWKNKSTPEGTPVSEVEPVEDEAAQRGIEQLIDSTELYCQVNFL